MVQLWETQGTLALRRGKCSAGSLKKSCVRCPQLSSPHSALQPLRAQELTSDGIGEEERRKSKGCAKIMAFYGENFIICRVTLRVRRSLSYFEQKIESAFAEISYCRAAGLPNRTTVLKVVIVGDVVSDWVAAFHICSLCYFWKGR